MPFCLTPGELARVCFDLPQQRDTVDAYLRELDREAEQIRQKYEAQNPPKVTREDLLARLEKKRRQDNT